MIAEDPAGGAVFPRCRMRWLGVRHRPDADRPGRARRAAAARRRGARTLRVMENLRAGARRDRARPRACAAGTGVPHQLRARLSGNELRVPELLRSWAPAGAHLRRRHRAGGRRAGRDRPDRQATLTAARMPAVITSQAVGGVHFSRIVTSSSARSDGARPSRRNRPWWPRLHRDGGTWTISRASGPTMCTPTTRCVSASTTSFMSVRSSRPTASPSSGGRRPCRSRARAARRALGLGEADGADSAAGGTPRSGHRRDRPPSAGCRTRVSAKACPSRIATGVRFDAGRSRRRRRRSMGTLSRENRSTTTSPLPPERRRRPLSRPSPRCSACRPVA